MTDELLTEGTVVNKEEIVDAYQEHVKKVRERAEPTIEVRPVLDELEALMIVDLIERTIKQFKPTTQTTLRTIVSKMDKALSRARDPMRV